MLLFLLCFDHGKKYHAEVLNEGSLCREEEEKVEARKTLGPRALSIPETGGKQCTGQAVRDQ